MIPRFRAWNRGKKIMYLDITGNINLVISDDTWLICDISDIKSPIELVNWKTGILMQSTGLKDKNGKEIFEGDIVKNNKQIGIVEREEGDWDRHWTHVIGLAWWLVDYPEEGVESAHPDNIEVIGNIYENPELVEGRTT